MCFERDADMMIVTVTAALLPPVGLGVASEPIILELRWHEVCVRPLSVRKMRVVNVTVKLMIAFRVFFSDASN